MFKCWSVEPVGYRGRNARPAVRRKTKKAVAEKQTNEQNKTKTKNKKQQQEKLRSNP
jgi:hypothetical protein